MNWKHLFRLLPMLGMLWCLADRLAEMSAQPFASALALVLSVQGAGCDRLSQAHLARPALLPERREPSAMELAPFGV